MMTMLAAQNWGLFIVRGLLALLLGVLAFVSPGPTLAGLIFAFGVYAIVDGLFAIGAGVGAPTGPRWWIVIGGVLGVVAGVYAFINPGLTALALVFVIGAFSIVRGAAEIVTAVTMRKMIEGEWLYILSGAVSVLFGAFLIVSPGTGALAVLWLIGYFAIFTGIMFIVVGLRLRSVAKTDSSGSRQAAATS